MSGLYTLFGQTAVPAPDVPSIESKNLPVQKPTQGTEVLERLLTKDVNSAQRGMINYLLGKRAPGSKEELEAQRTVRSVAEMLGTTPEALRREFKKVMASAKPFERGPSNPAAFGDLFTIARQTTEWLGGGEQDANGLIGRFKKASVLGKAVISSLVRRSKLAEEQRSVRGMTSVEDFKSKCRPRLRAQADALLSFFDLARADYKPTTDQLFQLGCDLDDSFSIEEKQSIFTALEAHDRNQTGVFSSSEQARFLMRALATLREPSSSL
jgi:hypothetical protein